MSFFKNNLFISICLFIALSGHQLMAVSIIKNGVAKVDIIVCSDSFENKAAQKLSQYIKKISGAELRIAKYSKNSNIHNIYISNGRKISGFDIDFKNLQDHGFAIKTNNGNLAIIGKDANGTEYGVNYFLEKYCGVRWFFPGKLGTIIPKRKTITLQNIDEIQNPDFKKRSVGTPQNRKWQKHNLIGNSMPYVGGHSFYKHIPAEKYWKSNPEYFGVKNGKRYKPPHLDNPKQRKWGGWQICTSNPKVVDLVAKSCFDLFEKKTNVKVVSICPNDGGGWCECAKCRALDTKKGSYSERVFKFANAVAAKVASKYPDKYLLMFAYEDYQRPPEDMKIHPNIIIWYTYSAADSFREKFNNDQIIRLKKWASLSKHIWIYEYYISECWSHFTPRFISKALGTEIKLLKKIKIEGYQTQSGNDWAINGPNYYIATKLLWNSSLIPQKLMNEYCTILFGPAAGELKGYFLTMENVWANGLSKTGMPSWFGHFPDDKELEVYTEKDLKKCDNLFKQAVRKVKGNALVLERIKMFRSGLIFTQNHIAILKAMKELTKSGVVISYHFKVTELNYSPKEIKNMMFKVKTLINKQFAFIESQKKSNSIGYYWLTDPGTRAGRYVPRFERKLKLLEKYMKAYNNQTNKIVYKLPRKWKFRTDPENLGLKRKWNKTIWKNAGLIPVPAFWNKTDKYENYGGIAWYRADFNLPADVNGEKTYIKFGAVDAEANVYINGQFAGKHKYSQGSWQKTFQFDISNLIKSGKNTATIRVDGHGRNSGIWQAVSIYTFPKNLNLIQNGNFEKGIKAWDWNPHRNKKGIVTPPLIISNGRGGKCIVKKTRGQVTQLLFLKSGVKYKLSGMIKVEGLQNKSFADIYINFAPGCNARVRMLKTNSDWINFSKVFSAKKTRANITLRLIGEGKVYFDNIELIEFKEDKK